MFEHFGNLTISRRKKHNFLVMDVELLAYAKLYLFMKDYIDKSIDLFEEQISMKVSSSAKRVLHNIYESSTRLEDKDANILHPIVAKLIRVEKGEGPTLSPPYRSCAPE